MSEMTIITQIPSLGSGNLSEFISGMIQAALKGIKILITSDVYEKLSKLFEELGITVKEVPSDALSQLDTYILIRRTGGIRVKLEVYEAGKMVNSIATTLSALERALKSMIEKQKGPKEAPRLYEVVLPRDLLEVEEEPEEGEGDVEL